MITYPEMITEHNCLPYDGTVYYWGSLMSSDLALNITARLLDEVSWKNDEAVIYGKHIITRRQYAWYADKPYAYTYSGISRCAMPWTALLGSLRKQVEAKTGNVYNSCLLNLYPDGQCGMAWHSDDEKDLVSNGSIASLSFGASRRFAMKHSSSKQKQDFILHSGDLLEMCDETQSNWVHCIPKTKTVHEPRINLTFRQMLK